VLRLAARHVRSSGASVESMSSQLEEMLTGGCPVGLNAMQNCNFQRGLVCSKRPPRAEPVLDLLSKSINKPRKLAFEESDH
jgi:hypothetical protein